MPRRTACVIATICALLLVAIGLALIYSATHQDFGTDYLVRQGLYIIPALGIMIGISWLPRRRLMQLKWWIYLGGLLLLVVTLMFGVEVRGQRSWLDFFLFRVQASELMKPILLLIISDLTAEIQSGSLERGNGLVILGMVFLVPILLILLQGDMGTSLIYVAFFSGWLLLVGFWRDALLFIGLLAGGIVGLFASVFSPESPLPVFEPVLEFLNGVEGFVLFAVISLLLIFGMLVSYLFYGRPHDLLIPTGGILGLLGGWIFSPYMSAHHLRRIEVFFDPYKAPLETGYNIIQSQIALGSGGFWGQGYLEGSQSQLGFIPELWTDFIFTVAVEELGLFGGLIIIGLFVGMVYSLFSSAVLSDDWQSYYLSAGAGLFIALHVAVNLGVCVGVLPVIGLPLLFVSYGGSALVMGFSLLGLVWLTQRRVSGRGFWRSDANVTQSLIWFKNRT